MKSGGFRKVKKRNLPFKHPKTYSVPATVLLLHQPFSLVLVLCRGKSLK